MDLKIIVNLFYQPKQFILTLLSEDDNSIYFPINGGCSLKSHASEFPWLHFDNVDDNISSHNSMLNEMTSIYWFWKNYDLASLRYVGFNHYRRLFSPNDVVDYHDYDIIAGNPIKLQLSYNIVNQYAICHDINDLNICVDVLNEIDTCSAESFQRYCMSSELYAPCNMFIMKTELFKQYCEFMFPVLFSLEKHVDLKPKDKYQSRAIAFLSERLTSWWIANKKKEQKLNVKKIPIKFIA